MQSGSNPTLDANAAHPQDIREDDPRHLGNLTKKMNSLNAQVSADTKYDPTPPKRVDKDGNPVEGFFVADVPVSSLKMESEKFYALGGIAVIIIIAVFINLLDPRLRYFVLRNNNLIRLIGLTLLFCVTTIIIVYICRKKLNSDIWYQR